jgi:hypothetical protein
MSAAVTAAARNILALTLVAALSACGGGGSGSSSSASSPEAVATSLRAEALRLAAGSVTPAQAAALLMDFAETNYPDLFPSHKENQTDAPPFLYRHYEETGIYLGVVVQDGSGLALNGVYVMGGPFGNTPLFVGPLSKFLPGVIVDNAVTGGDNAQGNGCYDLALFDTQGTQSMATYQSVDSLTGDLASDMAVTTSVGGMTVFEGQSARETVVTTTGNTYAGGAVAFNSQNKFYDIRNGDEVTHYGDILTTQISTAGLEYTTTIKSVDSPPFVDRQYTLAIGQSVTDRYQQNVTTTIGGQAPRQGVATTQTTTKYLGREDINVRGKTYSTCKFEVTSPLSPEVITSWNIVGKGILVKSVDSSQTVEATSVTLNGQPL